ncbi:hypothetical protein LPB260_23880 [Pseudomonas sp. LPB0260]|uniref:hypothetical protein n=1 Tax=Pseudomonas sp. LPB0260 TaxID=2614442 RepID=UPI0015C1E7F8|nr:hypothetical protein [Pseudomonas sp. LPB0260]QLC73763.1 hypothetical protein LPB260_08930 [Pseudomonas sp. LPB0260]QLC76537.1 hypothetical protein LPB260_23880 [Pseudomonas sp. LPB0260]
MNYPSILALALGLFATNALALPSQIPQPLLGELKDSQQNVRPQDRHVAEGGAERTPGQQGLRLAEGGAERLLEQHGQG